MALKWKNEIIKFRDQFTKYNMHIWQWGCLPWRVIYPDGEISVGMGLKVAKDYAEMFDGEVVHTLDIESES